MGKRVASRNLNPESIASSPQASPLPPSPESSSTESNVEEPTWLRTTLAAEVSLLLAEHFGSVLHVQKAIGDSRVQAVRSVHHENQFVDVRLDDESIGSISVRLNHVGKRAVITRSLHRSQEEIRQERSLAA
jgi:hypothetical protein